MLLKPADFTLPMPPDRLYGRAAPLVMEVGFGDGGFLAHLAAQHPDWNLLGAEIALGSVTRAFKRMRRERAQNVRLYLGHARFLVRNVLPPRSLHRVYVNFPDPWPKKRHRERRLLRAPFFKLLSTRLDAGGALYFTTDHAEYFDFALEEAEATGLFEITEKPPPSATLETKYARKWRAQNIPIQHVVFSKTGEAAGPFPPLVETTDAMHHALLDGALPPATSFEKIVHAFKGGTVVVLEAFQAVEAAALVFAVRIEEEDLTQEVLVEARPARKETADYFVGIKPFGQPLVTRGTREAVGVVAGWLVEGGMTLAQRFF